MRFRSLALTSLLVAGLSLTACSTATTSSTSGTTTSAVASASVAATSTMNNSNPNPASLLSVADVEKTSGLTGLKLVKQGSTTEAVGRLNFANADGTLVAIMNIGDGVAFNQSMQGMYFSKESTGTGDMCFVGPSSKVSTTLSIFAAAKGDHAVIMKTFAKTKGGSDTWLTIEQLQALTGLALGRWGA